MCSPWGIFRLSLKSCYPLKLLPCPIKLLFALLLLNLYCCGQILIYIFQERTHTKNSNSFWKLQIQTKAAWAIESLEEVILNKDNIINQIVIRKHLSFINLSFIWAHRELKKSPSCFSLVPIC